MKDLIFLPCPILITERLTLRPLSMIDEQGIFALRSDPEINKYLDRPPSKTMEDARNFIKNISESIKKNTSLYWAILWSESQTFVGTICLFEFSDSPKKCELGYELLSPFQGKGVMQEAASKVLEYAVQTIKVQTIAAFTHQNNRSSIRLLEKLDFKKLTDLDSTPPDHDIFLYSICP